MLWNVRIPLRKKVALLGVFSLTIIIMVVSVIRVAFVRGFGVGLGEQTATTEWLFLWSYVEMAVGEFRLPLFNRQLTNLGPKAIIVACTASFRQLFVFSRKQQTQRTGHRHRSFLQGIRFTHLSRGVGKNEYLYHQCTHDPNGIADGTPEHLITPLESVYVQRTFDITSARSSPSAYTRLDMSYRG